MASESVTDSVYENLPQLKSALTADASSDAAVTPSYFEQLNHFISHDDILQFVFLTKDLMTEEIFIEVMDIVNANERTCTRGFKLQALLEGCTQKTGKKFIKKLLLELFYLTKKYKMLKIFGSCKHKLESQDQDHWITKPFRRFLYDICESLSHDELEFIRKNLLPKSSPMTAECVMEELISSRLLTIDNINTLDRQFKALEREDLTNKSNQYISETSYYDLTPVRKGMKCGLAVIFNHFWFEKDLDPRKGTEIDRNNLRDLWEMFNFKVVVHNDLNRQETLKEMIKYAKQEENLDYKIFVCCILSHGDEGRFFTAENDTIEFSEVMEIFGTQADNLAGKPKLFFIQACQGDRRQFGYKEGKLAWDRKGIVEDSPTYSSFSNAPLYSDLLVGNSTVPGFVSYRDTDKGSFYITTLTEVFREKGYSEDIWSLLTQVNNRVANERVKDGERQMATVKSQLRLKLKFHKLEPN